jgi:amino acid adenylation domain-containing protein
MSKHKIYQSFKKEQHKTSYNCTNPKVESSIYKCFHELFAEQVLKTPDAIAVRFQEQYLTYAQLNDRANQLAHHLQSLGVSKEAIVGISLERSLEMVIGLLAILKAGAAYLPLDPTYPKERLSFILEDAKPAVLLTQQHWLANFPGHKTQVICLDTDYSDINQNSKENPQTQTKLENLAYVIYTSGSTGQPKGVMVEHFALINHSLSIVKEHALQTTDNVLQFASVSFDVAAEELFPTWLSGATVVLRPNSVTPTMAEFQKLIEQEQLTILNLPASYWHEWVLALDSGETQLPESVRLVIVGNEKVLPDRLTTWLYHFGNRVRWLNAYGLTETTITSTIYEPEMWLEQPDIKSVPIGRPIANTEVYILDENQNQVIEGMTGELYIGGFGLARNYLNRSELTNKRFIRNPFNDEANSRLFRTGDSARILPDGNIEVIGRVDNQVKIRGFRIQPEEIEACLNQHPSVDESVVVAHEDKPGQQYLVAYIVPHPGNSLTNKQLLEFLNEKLPKFMIPSALVCLNTLPLTPNNKIDRRALPKPDKSNLNLEKEYLAPRNNLEHQLTNIWEKLLNIQPIGIQDDFFSLGGNSLIAASLVTEIKKISHQNISPAIFFENPTIEKLAEILIKEELSVFSSVVKIQVSGDKKPLFIIANDSYLYKHVVQHLDPNQPVYVIQEPLGQVEEMASRCIKQIRAIQPEGSYNLLGHSFEGLVAYEIAQQFYTENQTVAFLGLIDIPTPELEIKFEESSFLRRLYLRFKLLFKLSWKDRISFFQERIQYRMSESFKPLMPTLLEFVSEYKPKNYPGEITVFTATHELYAVDDLKLGWSEFANDGVKVYEIPSTHRSILLEPKKAKIFAKQLTEGMQSGELLSVLPNPTQPLSCQWSGAVHTNFCKQAQKLPESLAVVDAHVSWSYGELDARSNKLANYLLENGVQSQEIVAIYAHRSASLIWALLGILKAGAAFVILDPAYPTSRLIDCLNVAKPKAWLQIETAGELPTALAEFLQTLPFCCRLKLSPNSLGLLEAYTSDNPMVTVSPDNLAYIAFTSGSTGKPKGILGTHNPLFHFMQWHCQTFSFTQKDRFSMLSGLAHDPLLRDIFTPLWLGATICIPEQKDIETPGKLADWMKQMQISITHLTPAMGQLLCNTTPQTKTNKISSLRYAFFGGDILKRYDVETICELGPNITCVNFYGATETPQAMGYFIVPNLKNKAESNQTTLKQRIPLGKGIEHVQLLILTPTQQLAKIGEVGEIYIRTPYLSQGYMSDDGMTQQKFITNPFTGIPEDKLYKTGDLGQYLSDGNIECLGRSDFQVKIRGFRIEIAEIEGTIAQHPDVRETIVIPKEDDYGNKNLIAYMVPQNKPTLSTQELRQFVSEKLPTYMIPSAFVVIEALPLTPNGKIDRAKLPTPEHIRQGAEQDFIGARNDIESQLIKIWEKALGIQPIGVTDNFFELGGHSLSAIRVLAEIEKVSGKNLTLSAFLQAQTIEQLASLIAQEAASAPCQSLVTIQKGSNKTPLFCVHAVWGNVLFYQQLAHHLEPDQPIYGLQAQGVDGKLPPSTSVTDMASRYIKEMQTVQPKGPYFICGYSFGGLVAFEIAQQLHTQGQEVALLALLDTCNHKYSQHNSQPTSENNNAQPSFLSLPYHHLTKIRELEIKELFAYIYDRFEYHLTVGQLSIFHRLYLRYIVNSQQDIRLLDIAKANNQAKKSYTPQFYPGRLTLFHANRKTAGSSSDSRLGWASLVTETELHEIPGSHTDMMVEPQVQLVAIKLQLCLEEIRKKAHKI